MVLVTGKYLHERNENIEKYFESIGKYRETRSILAEKTLFQAGATFLPRGVPYLARKMISLSHPTMEISQQEEKWTIKNISLMNTQEVSFRLGQEYEEVMPAGDKLQSLTTLEGNTLVTISRSADGNKVTRRYDFDEAGLTLTMSHERGDQIGKRYYKRLA